MKKVSLLLILALSALSVSAQEAGESKQAGRKTTFEQNGFFDNWFVGAGVGANMYLGKNDNHAGFFKRPTIMGSGQIGKWINPYLGVRAKASLGKVHTFENHAETMYSFNLATAEVDVMIDPINYFSNYREDRFYNIIFYAGIGASYGRTYTKGVRYPDGSPRHHEKGLTYNGGIINNFRITDKLSAQVEISGIVMRDAMDRRTGGKMHYDLLGQATVGVVYKIGHKTTSFAEATLMDQGLVDDLNDQINRLKKENDELARRPKNCPDCPEVAAPKIVEVEAATITGNAVFFRIGSSQVDANQEANIYNVAKYLKDNPKEKVSIVGYADKQTGSASINNKLSEKRAKTVADALSKKYGIDSSRINIQWKGDKEQPYEKNAWNRVVIFISE